MSSTDKGGVENGMDLVRRWLEDGWNKCNPDLADTIFARNYLHHEPAVPELITRTEDAKRNIRLFHAAFPDLHITIDDQLAAGDKVMTRWTVRGTHKGQLLSLAPTGKQITVQGMVVSRIEGGRIAEEWDLVNTLGLLEQLGAIEQDSVPLPPGVETN